MTPIKYQMAWVHPHQLFKNFPTKKKEKLSHLLLECNWVSGIGLCSLVIHWLMAVCVCVCVCVYVWVCVCVCVYAQSYLTLCDHVGCSPGFPVDSAVNNLPKMWRQQEMWVQSLGQEDPLEEGTATHSSILAWGIPWTEEPGGLQFMELQRAEHEVTYQGTAG